VEQQYLPGKIGKRVFYYPSERGFEKEIRRRMEALRKEWGRDKGRKV
jgi:replication-associated recombination protein RarA